MKKTHSTASTAEKSAAILQWLEEHKGKNPVALNLSGQNACTECMIVVSATSVRHAQSLADGLSLFCKEQHFEFLRVEGKQTGQWILLDLNDIVVHIFQEAVRDLYRLESLWAGASPSDAPQQTPA